MSSATPSRFVPTAADGKHVVVAWAERLADAVRASAFWTAAILPLFILGAVVAGTAGQHPEALIAALVVNALCAIIGHNHAPNE